VPIWIVHLALQAAITPVGELPFVEWSKGSSGYAVAAEQVLEFDHSGPGSLLLDLRAERSLLKQTAVTMQVAEGLIENGSLAAAVSSVVVQNNAAAPARIAVYDLKLDAIEPSIGTVVTDSVLAEVRKLEGISAIGMKEIREMLSHEAEKQMFGCESEDSCLAEIGGALGVDFLVTGSLSKAAESHVMSLRLIDQEHARVTGAVQRRLKAGSGQEFLLAVGPSIEELFPGRPVREGAKRGVPDEVALRLDPPPLPTWSFWTAAGTTVGAAAVGGLFGILARSAQGDYNDLAAQSQQTTIEGRVLKDKSKSVSRNNNTANGLFITAGVLAVTSAIVYLFTDWEGYADSETSAGVSVGAY